MFLTTEPSPVLAIFLKDFHFSECGLEHLIALRMEARRACLVPWNVDTRNSYTALNAEPSLQPWRHL